MGSWIQKTVRIAAVAPWALLPFGAALGQVGLPLRAAALAQADSMTVNGSEAGQDLAGAAARGIFAAPDRTLVQLLGKAESLVEEGRYVEAVRCLGAILDSPEDYFYQPDRGGPVHRSLKSEAERMLGRMPPHARELYELQYGAQARQMLLDAALAGDEFSLAEVSRRFFHTEAGYEATLLLGLHHLSEARPLAAALTLERLHGIGTEADRFEPTLSVTLAACWIRCEAPDKAWRVLAELRERHPSGKVSIGGQDVLLFPAGTQLFDSMLSRKEATALLADAGSPLGRLAKFIGLPPAWSLVEEQQWAMLRGNPARTAVASGSGPLLSPRWSVPTTDQPYIEALIAGICRDDEDHGQLTISSLHPLAVDDVLLMRTARNLLAVDFATGKRIWETAGDDPFEAFVNPSPEGPAVLAAQIANALRMRLWGDATYGTMSSDGERVFAIEDLRLPIGPAGIRGFLIPPGSQSPEPAAAANRLAAFDVRTGKLKWHLGGSEEEYGLPEAGTFFLGPPLPLMKQLFVLADTKGEIRLLAIEAETGGLLWSQQIADADREVLLDPLRRYAGVSPSYADGILVCPTSNRAIVALELATRALLWGYTYGPGDGQADQPAMFLGMRALGVFDRGNRWFDPNATLAEGCVLVTPIDSQEIHCLSLVDGRPLWKKAREDDLYLAGVHEGKAVLVGRRQVRALRLADGEPAWQGRTVAYPGGGSPSGTGFLNGDFCFVPLSTAEVLAVDLDAGTQAHLYHSRRGSIPGNLICYEDKVISQRAGSVEVYHQLDALKAQVDERLAAEPRDGEALTLRGEVLWYEGKLGEAIDSCRRALEAASTPRGRDLLREAYFEGLETDFAAHRDDLERIGELIDTPGQRGTYLRLLAAGYASAGEFQPALESCLRLLEVDREDRQMELLDRSHSVRRDRWIQIELGELREAAPEVVRTDLDAAAKSRFQAAVEDPGTESLQLFLDYFGRHPLGDEAQSRLAARFRASGRLIEAELLLRARQRLADRERAGEALAELAAMLRWAKRWEDAAACYAQLSRRFAEIVCLGGKTGRQLREDLPADDAVRSALEATSPWPVGEVKVKEVVNSDVKPPVHLSSAIDYGGSMDPFLSDFQIELGPNPPVLVGRDGWGRTRWQVSLADLALREAPYLNRNGTRATASGHLLLLRTGETVTAVDLLGEGRRGSPRVLWTRRLDESESDHDSADRIMRVAAARLPGNAQVWLASRSFGTRQSSVVFAGEQLACMLRLRTCIAVDTATGRTVWIRENLPSESTVFGDDEYVFVTPADGGDATVLRAADGQTVGTRPVPPEPERLATFGRRVLTWRSRENHRVLELTDSWDGGTAWPPLKFTSDAQLHLLEKDRKVAVFEPEGRFVLVDLSDGRAEIDAGVEAEPLLSGIYLIPSSDQYLLVVQAAESPVERSVNRQTHATPGTQSVQIAHGRVYAYDHQGQFLWPGPAEIESQHLPLDQPRRLPVLAFASVVREREQGQYRSSISILAIDKRTGRKVLETSLDRPTSRFQIMGDPEKKQVSIRMQQDTVVMTFTGKPWPPEVENGQQEALIRKEAAPPASRALWNALRKAALGL